MSKGHESIFMGIVLHTYIKLCACVLASACGCTYRYMTESRRVMRKDWYYQEREGRGQQEDGVGIHVFNDMLSLK